MIKDIMIIISTFFVIYITVVEIILHFYIKNIFKKNLSLINNTLEKFEIKLITYDYNNYELKHEKFSIRESPVKIYFKIEDLLNNKITVGDLSKLYYEKGKIPRFLRK